MRIGNSLGSTTHDRTTPTRFAIGELDLGAIGNAIVRIRAPVRMGTFQVSRSTAADISFDVRWSNEKPIIGNVNIRFTPSITTEDANLFGIHVARDGRAHKETDSTLSLFSQKTNLETLLNDIGVVLKEATFQVEPYRNASAQPSLDTFGIRAWTVSSGEDDLFVGDLA